MTSDRDIAAEAGEVFNALSIGTLVENTEHLLVAPLSLQNKIISLIDRQIAEALQGRDAYIGLKLNSLTDKVLIDKLMEASRCGVKIQMVIRGICCLVAGVKDCTENIEVTSIVGRYLEHARIYMFGRGENMKMYISSADFMTRNTIRRVEVAAPIYDKHVRSRIVHIWETMLADNVKARVMQPDSTYVRRTPAEGEVPVNSQDTFIEEAYKNAELVVSAPPVKQAKKVKPVLKSKKRRANS
jgi:polyphosphate kinase